MLIYLHGFNSSPASHKAQVLKTYMEGRGLGTHYACPALPDTPGEAVRTIERAIAGRDPRTLTFLGSSLGGFYATWLAERHGLRAVLVNPAVLAHLSLADYVGPQTNLYTGEEFQFTREHVAQLQAMEVADLRPERYWLLVEEGDEVLDYRQAVARYRDARQTVLAGGDHSFTRFVDFVPQILEFAGL